MVNRIVILTSCVRILIYALHGYVCSNGALCLVADLQFRFFLFFIVQFQATMDIFSHFFNSESCDIHLNHGDILEAIWSWTGIKPENRQKVAEVRLILMIQ